ncbi:phosphoenolpyruvate carboxylase [Vibrio chagasii]|nr:phosphoenolpyruvate carboxylase [Vibrio chagasii]
MKGGLRVTEQGEMIRFKLGLARCCSKQFQPIRKCDSRSEFLPPPEPKQEWRDLMEVLSQVSCEAYRNVVRGEEKFVPASVVSDT